MYKSIVNEIKNIKVCHFIFSFSKLSVFLILQLFSENIIKAQDCSLDQTFNVGTSFDGQVNAIAIQSDGKIIVGGSFSNYNGSHFGSVVRLEPNGNLDSSFNTVNAGSGFSVVDAIAIQSDGKIIIGSGMFGLTNSITRVNTDGSIDTTFNPGLGFLNPPSSPGHIYAIAIQPDGKILVGGDFIFPNYYLARLNQDGSNDSTFLMTNLQGTAVKTIAIQFDSLIIAGGIISNAGSHNYLTRINKNGTKDLNFNIGTSFDGQVNTVSLQQDGRIIVAGSFSLFDGTPINKICRLNTSGTLDTSFHIGNGADGSIYSAELFANNKIAICGAFFHYNGITCNKFAVLNSDGSNDLLCNTGSGYSFVYPTVVKVQSDGKFIVGGNYTSYNGISTRFISRLGSGTSSIQSNNSESSFQIYPNPNSGKFIICFFESIKPKYIRIFSMDGRLIFHKNVFQLNNLKFELENQKSGIYFIEVYDGVNVITQKLIIFE